MASQVGSFLLPEVVGVIGAGQASRELRDGEEIVLMRTPTWQMGAGIAQLCASKGLKVIISDRNFALVERGVSSIHRSLEKLVKAGKMSADDAGTTVGRIESAVSLEPFRKADFVIEAAPEDEEVKKNLFRKLDQVTPISSILASNTSSISITRLAAVTNKPHRVVGMHFMHPVGTTMIVELAKGMHTSNQTYESTVGLCQHLGKNVCVSQDRPGFILYRVMMPMINEAFFCMMEGVGSPEDIDRGMRLGTNMALGPLKLADSIGLDTCLSIMRVLHQQFGDSKYRPCPLLVQYVDGGWLGVKTGRGVFYYDPAEKSNATNVSISHSNSKDRVVPFGSTTISVPPPSFTSSGLFNQPSVVIPSSSPLPSSPVHVASGMVASPSVPEMGKL